ncbi:lysophospholipid acyltransferase family protein [Propionicicella superfundia]|uniref:lysophospholipid acyltransferase family protein n=1 Tax=Propionicicella superfundia TaxID=348582 RepID=UPI0004245D67|nr:lysophospholipid acyltransferase family protein [Propionicicella superfundia]
MTSSSALSRRADREPSGRLFRLVGWLGGGLLRLTTRQDWRPGGGLPRTGGVIVVVNHVSNFDPVALGHFLIGSGRWPRYLAKRELWDVPVLGWLLRELEQIPVARNTQRASDALTAARQALERGRCVVVYPEGTITDDPEGWPMTGRPGAAILACETGCPVVPIGQWGAQEVMGYRHPTFPRLVPRKVMRMAVGVPFPAMTPEPEPSPERVRALTIAYMDAVAALVGSLRGRTPPADRYDPRVGKRVPRPKQPSEVDTVGPDEGNPDA